MGEERIGINFYPDDNGNFPEDLYFQVLRETNQGKVVGVHNHSIPLAEQDMPDLCSDECRVFLPW